MQSSSFSFHGSVCAHVDSLADSSKEEVTGTPLATDALHTWATQAVYLFIYLSSPLCQEQTQPPAVYHPNPGETRLACQLTEEEQIRIAQRIGLIQHLPKGLFEPGSDSSEKKVHE